MITLFDFLREFERMFQVQENDIFNLIKLGPANPIESKKFMVNKCIISPNFNYNAISSFLEENADLMLLFYTWNTNQITDDLYKKFRFIGNKKICIIEFPKSFYSIPFGIHERIGFFLGLELDGLFNLQNYSSGRIFKPKQLNFNFNLLLNIISNKINQKYINYICPNNKLSEPLSRILIYLEKPLSEDIIIHAYRKGIDAIICSKIDFVSSMTANDHNIKLCELSDNWLNIVLYNFTRDISLEIPKIQFIFKPVNIPIKMFSS